MKHTIIILASFALAIAALHAADPVVVLTDNGTVIKDGVNHNNIADALLNKAIATREFADALSAWQTKVTAERDAAKAALEAKKQRIQEVLQKRLSDEQKTGEGPKTKLLRDLLTDAAVPDKLLKQQALEAEIAAKQKELEALR